MRKLPVAVLLLLAACGTPGGEVAPIAGDFAFLEVRLKG
jgi:hypothetical protein